MLSFWLFTEYIFYQHYTDIKASYPKDLYNINMTTLFTLTPITVLQRLSLIAITLALLHVIAMVVWYKQLIPLDNWITISFFDLDEEESLGTWFSTLLLALCALTSGLVYKLTLTDNRTIQQGWTALMVGFPFLSLDEVAGFHEYLNTVVTSVHWTSIGLVGVFILGLLFLPFLWALPNRTRGLLILAGGFYIGGAVGVEMATIHYETHNLLDTLEYNLWNTVEEFFEMFGAILYIYAALDWACFTQNETPYQGIRLASSMIGASDTSSDTNSS